MSPFITSNESASYYECGFSCDNAIVFNSGKEIFFITDERYTLEAKQKCKKNVEIIHSDDLINSLCNIAKNVKNIIFDPLEWSIESYNKLIKNHISLVAKSNFHQQIRMIKTPKEIELIAHSQRLNKMAFKKFSKYLTNHYSSKQNEYFLHFKARKFLEQSGKYNLSFNPIVALNQNAAKPHALPTNDKLKKGSLLLFDAGIKYKRYCSDMTRTAFYDGAIHFSKKQRMPKKIQKIYDIVLKAQENTIKHTRSGMKAKEIDALARNIIYSSGYGDYFTHSLGHGVGLDIHELPRISQKSDTIIEDGMVFSIEPGIYIANEFGIRIEDLVVMKNGKAEIL